MLSLELASSSDAEILDVLTHPSVPLLSLEELTRHIQAFPEFLTRHRDYMALTGLPPAYFGDHNAPLWPEQWLHFLLGRTYPTRRTTSNCPAPPPGHRTWFHVLEADLLPTAACDPYRWLCTRALDSFCPREQADYRPGLGEDAVARIESERAMVFELKIGTLIALAENLGRNSGPDLVADCRKRMTDRLSPEGVQFYLGVDRNVLGPNVFAERTWPTEVRSHTGGLADLLELAYVIQHERQFGVLTRLRELLPDSRQDELWATVDEFPWESGEEPYLGFDEVKSVLNDRSEARRVHRDECLRALAALADPSAPVRLTVLTTAQEAVTLVPVLEGYVERLQTQLEAGESLAGAYVPVTSHPFWDRSRRLLWYRNHRVRSFRRYAPNSPYEVVLNAFERGGWPYEIDLPPPGSSGGRPFSESEFRDQIRYAVRSINSRLDVIRFEADGTRIRWYEISNVNATLPECERPTE